jgi:hypothetical protein
MRMLNFTLSDIEASYIVVALRIAYELGDFEERHKIVMTGLLDKMAAPLDLDEDIIARLLMPGRPS